MILTSCNMSQGVGLSIYNKNSGSFTVIGIRYLKQDMKTMIQFVQQWMSPKGNMDPVVVQSAQLDD